jgi:hypothetical protein
MSKMKRLFEAAILVVLQFLLVGTCYGGVWSEVEMEFTDQGKVAVYDIEVTGQGVLSVQVKDYEPDSTADYWRATIVILGAPGSGASSLCDIAVTNVGTPGKNQVDGYGPYAGKVDLLVSSNYRYLVLISYDRGSDAFTFGLKAKAKFSYTGSSITVNPRPF